MDMITNAYDDDSNTPRVDRNREESSERSPEHSPGYQSKMNSDPQQSNTAFTSKDSDCESSDSDDDSMSDQRDSAARASSGSSPGNSSMSSSDSERSHVSKEKVVVTEKDRRTSSSKMHHRRSRSHSGSRRRRRSSDRRKRSRSKDRHHKSSRSERRSTRHSRSRSRSRDRRTRHHSRERRRRDSHRRRHSPSRDSRRHRHSSTGRRHRRHSRSPGHRSRHSDRKRSRSPRPSTSSKPEETSNPPATTTASVTGSNRPPVYKVTGVKFGRGRGTSTGTFKDKMREEYRHRVQEAEDVLAGRSQLPSLMSSQVTSSVATVSAGTGVMGSGGLSQTLINHVQVLQQSSQYLPGQPGCLTAEQKALNQKVILESTGRTKQQVEAAWGVKIPSIYNENTNNLAEIAQRTKKRSLLWKGSDKKKTEVNSTFNAVPILPGQSTSENLRFARLMGCMKGKPTGEEKAEEQPKLDTDAEEKAIIETQILNNNLEREFESSRRFTHIHRGCGLGYNNTLYQPH